MRVPFAVFLLASSAAWSGAACVGEDPDTEKDDGADASTEAGAQNPDGSNPATGDGGTSSTTDAPIDSGPSGPCNLTAAWEAPVRIAEVSTTNDQSFARISPDGEEIFVSRDVGGNKSGIMRYRKQDGGTWGDPLALALNDIGDGATMHSRALSLTTDNKTAFFARTDQFNLNQGISKITRTGPLATWATPIHLVVKGPDGNPTSAQAPWINGDGTRLYYYSTSPASRVYEAPLQAGSYGPSKMIAFEADDRYPVLSADELTIFVASARPHPVPGGGLRIYTAKRQALTESFSLPDYVTELNDGFDEVNPSWLSPNGCTMLLWGQKTGTATRDVFIAKKPAN
jgi:hypothetical protein